MIRLALFLVFSYAWIGIGAKENKWKFKATGGIDMGMAIPIPMSAVSGDAEVKPRLMPTIGVGAQRYFNDNWSLGLDINYHILSVNGTVNVVSQPFWSDDRSYATYFSGEANTSTELRFLEFPLIARYHINEHWALHMGTYYSVILNAKLETEGKNGWLSTNKDDTDHAPLPGTQNTFYSFNDDLDNYDIGGLLGVTYNVSPRLIIWGRINVGFKSIFKPDFNNIDYEMYQIRFSMGISYVFLKR
jgi:long-subunit fatty acid transport protein